MSPKQVTPTPEDNRHSVEAAVEAIIRLAEEIFDLPPSSSAVEESTAS